MQIESVVQTADGYLVNGITAVPNDPANADYRAVQTWITQGNEPEQAPEPPRVVNRIQALEMLTDEQFNALLAIAQGVEA